MKYLKPIQLFQELLKTNQHKTNRLLGLDVGDKYVGLAISDVHNKVASPSSVLVRKKDNIDLMAGDFQLLISRLSLMGFVVGYPFNKQKNSADAVQVNLFINDLCATGKLEGVNYTIWEECFSSKSMGFVLNPLDLHHVHKKTAMDKFAAVAILQGYLDFVNRIQSSDSSEASSE
ncbi:OLC1v1029692C1 [Oldenlandia corymbosa var. corymbosa]|nr:OLC1v1029692C1 [Oldenlandia corymbosa var. corymbosa]